MNWEPESKISWLDFAEDDRRKMMEVVSLFKLRETRDELGLGSIRNAFADMLFPGTGTMQTRARYFLIVPWIYLHNEKNRVPSSLIAERLRLHESWIITTLLKTETDGVIGRLSGPQITRMPSSIYWFGLIRWGIFRHEISQGQYQRSLDRIYQMRLAAPTTDDGEPLDWNRGANWDPNLPDRPKRMFDEITLALTRQEADYLFEKVQLHCGESMLPFLIESGVRLGEVEFAWFHPSRAAIDAPLDRMLNHARNFSEVMYGAALLYNYLLAEMDKRESLLESYKPQLDHWHEIMSNRWSELRSWDHADFWTLAMEHGRIPPQTRSFVHRWVENVLAGKRSRRIEQDKKARSLVRSREKSLKGGRSRFVSKHHRQQWGGAAGNFQMDYRWWVTKRLVNDIIEGLERD